MSKVTEVDIALSILDHQLVDGDGQNCGKVDDLEIAGLDGDSPEVVEILVGGNAWRSRGLPRTARGPPLGKRRPRALARGRLRHLGRDPEAPGGGAAPEPRRRPLGRARREAAGILMRLSELLNRKVVTESGQRLGRVHDVRGELVGGRLRVTGPGRRQTRHPRALRRRHPRQRRTRTKRKSTATPSSPGNGSSASERRSSFATRTTRQRERDRREAG